MSQRTPYRRSGGASFAALRTETISQAGDRQRARSAAYHQRRRQAMMTVPVDVPMPIASTSNAAVRSIAAGNIRTTGLLGLEYKFIDQSYGPTAIANSWNGGEADPAAGVNVIGPCVQGSGESQRDGSRVLFKSVHIQGYIVRPIASDQADGRAGNLFQISLVLDTQSNGTQLNAEDVYGTTEPEIPGRRVVANSSRFKVLATRMISTQDPAMGTDGANTNTISGMMVPFQIYKKLNLQVDFVAGAGAGTIADFRNNSLHVIACSFNGALAETLSYNSRVRFVG